MADALRSHAREFSQAAAASHEGGFWSARAGLDPGDAAAGEPDVRRLRRDPEVLAALEELRCRDRLALRPGRDVRRERLPAIREDRVTLLEHLVTPAFPDGIRWLRDLDLLRLSDLAVGADQVPALFERYCTDVARAPLPDFLGALAVMVGKGILVLA